MTDRAELRVKRKQADIAFFAFCFLWKASQAKKVFNNAII